MMERNNKKFKWIAVILIDLVIILTLVIYFGWIRPAYNPRPKINGIFIDLPKDLPEFQLKNHHNQLLTKKDLLGHWTFLFFGFTSCPMVCPTTLGVLNQAYKILEVEIPAKALPHIVFVSVDPGRDTPERINEYLGSINKKFIGVTGAENEIASLEKQLSINVVKTNASINHSAEIILINPEGKIQAYFPYPAKANLLIEDYKTITNYKKI